MCVNTGYLKVTSLSTKAAKAAVAPIAQQIVHRGPDDQGVCTYADRGLLLPIIVFPFLVYRSWDYKPMALSSGQYVIAFNREAYNHLNLRRELNIAVTRTSILSQR
jgi:asparagine synthase (glutamine-hydrolysing)